MNKKKVTTAGKSKEAGQQGGGKKGKKIGGVEGKKTTAKNVV